MLDLKIIPWQDDSLKRKSEGGLVAKYLVSRSLSRIDAGIDDGFVFAIRGEYGAGKSYFLRNLARELSTSHPVAFIDAWESDTIGSPYYALLNALDTSLAPFLSKRAGLKKAATLLGRSGAVLGAAAKGAGKKFAEKYIGEELGEQVEALLTSSDDSSSDNKDSKAGEVGSKAIEDGMAQFKDAPEVYALGPAATLAELKLHRAARQAISDLRNAMKVIVTNIRTGSPRSPIFIFVDELDRCSPQYAVSLLEEMKHFFDVSGIVFVLGMQPDQLSRSIKGVYGVDFDGKAYLDRLIHHSYELSPPNTSQFIRGRLIEEPLPSDRFSPDPWGRPIEQCIESVFNYRGLLPREVDRCLEKMRTASFACQESGLLDASYLAFCCCRHIAKRNSTAAATKLRSEYYYTLSEFSVVKSHLESDDHLMLQHFDQIANEGISYINQRMQDPRSGETAAGILTLRHYKQTGADKPSMLQYYRDLLMKISPFSALSST